MIIIDVSSEAISRNTCASVEPKRCWRPLGKIAFRFG